MTSYDFSTFASRLHFRGLLRFDSALRIGASRSSAVDEPDLPVLRDAAGRPYIPGSSFKGALRGYIESVLRTLQSQEAIQDKNLACFSVGKPSARPQNDRAVELCLTQNEVSQLKAISPENWRNDIDLAQAVKDRLPNQPSIVDKVQQAGEAAMLDDQLRQLSCWTCRIFGSSWLASKVLIKDLHVQAWQDYQFEIRDGVGIDRDSGRAADGAKYQFETIPVGTQFSLEILAENLSEAELGVLWLGLRAFEQGDVLLGGAKSRGLGWCHLQPQWATSHYVDQSSLLDYLFNIDRATDGLAANQPQGWVQAFQTAITSEVSHA
ncbi:MAG: CRISPR-associated RAMP protein Csx7 [Chloroflexota bacterium]